MRALVVRELGNPLPKQGERQPLELDSQFPEPQLKDARAVKIRVEAGSLNFADALQVQGQYQVKAKLPFVPGSELSGTVTEVGSKVKSLKPGDRICAVATSAFAEFAIVPEAAALKLPQGADLATSAGLPVAFGTAHVALAHRAGLRAGQTVLILGAAGGVGMAAVQISKVLGATVVAVARGPDKAAALRELGADHVIDSGLSSAPLRQLVKECAPKGIDVVLDMVGGEPFREALKVANWGAHILFVGFATGDIPKAKGLQECMGKGVVAVTALHVSMAPPTLDCESYAQVSANIALVKNWTLHGVFWGSYMQHNPRVLRGSLEQLAAWLGEGKLHVPVSHRVPLERAPEAYKALLSRQSIGKVLILPQQGAAKL